MLTEIEWIKQQNSGISKKIAILMKWTVIIINNF